MQVTSFCRVAPSSTGDAKAIHLVHDHCMSQELIRLLALKDHPLRTALVDEMHVRRFPAFAAPARLTQLVMFTGEQTIAETRRSAEELCERFNVRPPNGRYFAVPLGSLDFIWECHTEVSTYTFIRRGTFTDPFDSPVISDIPEEWLTALPGQVLRATQVALVDRNSPSPDAALIDRWFTRSNLMSCEIQRGEARIWSDFLVHKDGMGRMLMRDQNLQSDGDTARLVQRLQELGNYRNMAMLGLPAAQAATPALSAFESRVTALTREIAGTTDDAKLLEELSGLSADLAKTTAETSYRMSATRAYAQLVFDRLRELEVTRVPGHQTLIDFIERRLTPAVRTCESFSRRIEDLSQRVSWASSAMRTRIETTLERQNTSLLESMNRRAHMQLRLQQTVEGLSVLAISYYFIGILGYVAKAFGHALETDVGVFQGVAAPFVLIFVWWFIRRVRRSYEAIDE
jgi:uncharacterized membrane-anchored protein